MKISTQSVYTSVACNRIPEVCDWNSDGLICYGACNAVVISDTESKDVDPLVVLYHHKSIVNSVKWLRQADGTCSEFISCSADKTAAIWTFDKNTWKVTSDLIGHADGVTCINGVYGHNNQLTVYTGSIDSTIKIWERINGITSLKVTIPLNSGLCLTLHSHLLPGLNQPVLFCALDDHKIHIFGGENYLKVHTLSGHEDWVRGLDVMNIDDSTIMLASASQDTYIRLWRIQKHVEQQNTSGIRVEEKMFEAYGVNWCVKLDAVLAGHEGWVYGVQWHPTKSGQPVYRLLSSSLDKTLIVWEPEVAPGSGDGQGVWVEKVRVGEVGGNGLGFYGSRFGPDGKRFLGHGYNGSFHIWKVNKETKQWQPQVVCGGHFRAVEDIRWEARGRYLVSVSSDQTTRLHAPWTRQDGKVEWHEIARPQVHGYDLSSIALVNSTVFASAAEEKVIRVFRAPHNFLTNFKNIVGEVLSEEDNVKGPEGASVPSLGLSNKAVFTDKDEAREDNDGYFVPVELTEPPTEESLMQNTLWPEVQKLYGHGNEVFTLDATSDGDLLASACKATSAEHAAILIWDTKAWQQIQKLISHQLTVTQLAFSPDSRNLLSVSRDRRWTLFRRQNGSNSFEIAASTDKTNGVHSRIIWCCAWAHDSSLFATGSRDGKVCLWSKTNTQTETSLRDYALKGQALELPNTSVTALAFAPLTIDGARLLAMGFETGIIRLYAVSDTWSLIKEFNNSSAHHLTVRRLTFQPIVEEKNNNKEVLLASCGCDHFVRIHRISLL